MEWPRRGLWSEEKKLQQTLILFFKVILLPLIHKLFIALFIIELDDQGPYKVLFNKKSCQQNKKKCLKTWF